MCLTDCAAWWMAARPTTDESMPSSTSSLSVDTGISVSTTLRYRAPFLVNVSRIWNAIEDGGAMSRGLLLAVVAVLAVAVVSTVVAVVAMVAVSVVATSLAASAS